MRLAPGLHNQSTAAAISSARPRRPIGLVRHGIRHAQLALRNHLGDHRRLDFKLERGVLAGVSASTPSPAPFSSTPVVATCSTSPTPPTPRTRECDLAAARRIAGTLTIYAAEPGSTTEHGLALLASWAATREADTAAQPTS
jgi:hypothetical protein